MNLFSLTPLKMKFLSLQPHSHNTSITSPDLYRNVYGSFTVQCSCSYLVEKTFLLFLVNDTLNSEEDCNQSKPRR